MKQHNSKYRITIPKSPVLIGRPWCWGWGGPSGRCTSPPDPSSSPCRWKVENKKAKKMDSGHRITIVGWILIVLRGVGRWHQIIAIVGFIPHCLHTSLEQQQAILRFKKNHCDPFEFALFYDCLSWSTRLFESCRLVWYISYCRFSFGLNIVVGFLSMKFNLKLKHRIFICTWHM